MSKTLILVDTELGLRLVPEGETDWCYVCDKTTAWTPEETCRKCGREWGHDEPSTPAPTPQWRGWFAMLGSRRG